jgi:phosphate:Na+ symporter
MSRGFVQASMRSTSFFTRGFNCRNRFEGAGFGFMYTVVVQSSDVTSVTLVRLADIGTITLFQACACIIGANIGTTVTTFIASLSGFKFLIPIFAFFAFVGAIPLLSKKKPLKIFGEVVAGFGILFIGLSLLNNSVENQSFRDVVSVLFSFTDNPIILIGIAVVFTMIVQSSSVVTAMVVFLTLSGLLPLPSALSLVVGANVGTCVTSWIAAIGSSRTGRQTAMFHTLFNLVGATIFLVVMFSPLQEPVLAWIEALNINIEFKVAIFHLAFNLIAGAVMIPLLRPNVWLCKKIIRH